MNPDEAVLLWVDEYTRLAESYEANIVPRFTPFTTRLVERASLKPHTMILDLSTGTGNAAILAAQAVGGTGLVVGIDLADGALAVAQTKAARLGLRNLRFEMLDSRNIVYRGGTFDAALTSFGLPSIGHEQVMREVYRVLKDGATFHILQWAANDPPSGWDAWTEVLQKHRTVSPSRTLAQLREAGDLVTKSGDYAAVRDPTVVTARLKAAGFSDVRTDPHMDRVNIRRSAPSIVPVPSILAIKSVDPHLEMTYVASCIFTLPLQSVSPGGLQRVVGEGLGTEASRTATRLSM